jgi:hypothetical protein
VKIEGYVAFRRGKLYQALNVMGEPLPIEFADFASLQWIQAKGASIRPATLTVAEPKRKKVSK